MIENDGGFHPPELVPEAVLPKTQIVNTMAYYDTSLRKMERRESPGVYIPGEFHLEDYRSPLEQYAISALLNVPSYLALNGSAVAGGLLGAAVNPLSHVDSHVAVGALIISYGAWISGVYANAKEAWTLLENSEVCTSVTAKAVYEFSRRYTDNKTIQKAATYVGFAFWGAVEEIPWFVSAIAVPDIIDRFSPVPSQNNKFSYLAGANLGAAAFNFVQSKGVGEINKSILRNENVFVKFKNKVREVISGK